MTEPYRYILVPGRHHLLTTFQARYLRELIGGWLRDVDGNPIAVDPHAVVVWAVTSANHQNTRRNPIPLMRRTEAIARFAEHERLPSLIVPINDVSPMTPKFAATTLKSVESETGIHMTPDNTVVAVSTPVMDMYRAFDPPFQIAPLELGHPEHPPLAFQVIEMLAAGNPEWRRYAHPATQSVIDDYGLEAKVRTIMSDPVVGSDGALTTTRNYRTYVEAFESARQRKWELVRAFVRPGRILDIGCATGGMLKLATREPALAESDFLGVEVDRTLAEICEHEKAEGAFGTPNIWFLQANILARQLFDDKSIDTTLTFALTHEIYSYINGIDSLRRLGQAIVRQTVPEGVWINSDVCGPADSDRMVILRFHPDQGSVDTEPRDLTAMSDPAGYLKGLPPASRFAQFAQDFRRNAGVPFLYERIDAHTVRLRLADAMEFMEHHTYVDSWLSESHEQFTAMTWQRWSDLIRELGLEVDPRSGPWRNPWLVDNMFAPAASLCDQSGQPIPWPDTHMLMVARRPAVELG